MKYFHAFKLLRIQQINRFESTSSIAIKYSKIVSCIISTHPISESPQKHANDKQEH